MFDPAGFPAAEVQFDKDAHLFGSDDNVMALAQRPELTDLVILVHGWNNNINEARGLYEGLASLLRTGLNDDLVPTLDGRTIGLAGLFWPSKKFTSRALIPGGAAAFGSAIDQQGLQLQIDDMRELFPGLADHAVLEKAKSLVPLLEDKATARCDFAAALRSLLDETSAEPEDATTDFFSLQPATLMNLLAVPATVIGPSSADGGATHIDMTPEFGGTTGGAVGLGGTLGGALGAAESLLNFITYYQMKTRAGAIGEYGLAPLVERIRHERADLRIHLVGHSFGGRLVTAAANQLPHHAVASMTLLQAAFSHYGFSDAWRPGQPGHFRNIILNTAVSGPILITHTSNDLAVGIAYAIASRITRQTAAAFGDANDTYGGIGRNGAQKTPEAIPARLLDVTGDYTWTPHKLHNLLADAFIKGHSDIKNLQVAYALLSAIGST